MKMAEQVFREVTKGSVIAATLSGNYVVFRDGSRAVFDFDPPRTLSEVRKKGRCTRWVGEYSDGSVLEMRYSFEWGSYQYKHFRLRSDYEKSLPRTVL